MAPLQPHGTIAAYARHRRAGEEACAECKKARAAYTRSRYVPTPRTLDPCGTPGAYLRHLRRGEETCQPCRDAYEARRRAAPPPGEHGTNGGYAMHSKRHETPCEPCHEAHLEYLRQWRAKRARRKALERMLAEAWEETVSSPGVASPPAPRVE